MKRLSQNVGGGASSLIGFTLAEVLIVLGIIGVVAALTMPSLISNYQKKITVTRLKEAYSILSQTVVFASVEHGDQTSWGNFVYSFANQEEVENNSPILTKEFADKYIVKYISDARVHGWISVEDVGIKNGYVGLNGKQLTNGNLNPDAKCYTVELKNGQILYIILDVWKQAAASCIIYVDVNGRKGPNMFGKDTFTLMIYRGKLQPYYANRGIDTVKKECVKGAEWGSITCAALIIHDGWQITKDYPW